MKIRTITQPFWSFLLALVLCVTGGSSAHAQVAPTPSACELDAECNRLASAGSEASQAGRFAEAQRAYKAAYDRQPDVVLLFNLARVLHKGGQLAEAVRYYQQYLDAGAEGSEEQRRKAEQRMAEARSEQAAAATAVKPSPPPAQSISLLQQPERESSAAADSPRSVPVYRKWWLWTVVGVAVVGVAVGVGLGVAAQRPDLTGYADARPFGS